MTGGLAVNVTTLRFSPKPAHANGGRIKAFEIRAALFSDGDGPLLSNFFPDVAWIPAMDQRVFQWFSLIEFASTV